MGAVEGASYTLVIVGGGLPVHPPPSVTSPACCCTLVSCMSKCSAPHVRRAANAACAGLAVAGAVLWAAANELLIQPKEYTCFNLALERIRYT
jgi:hypothetical protein